jgi:hypothetical protein
MPQRIVTVAPPLVMRGCTYLIGDDRTSSGGE